MVTVITMMIINNRSNFKYSHVSSQEHYTKFDDRADLEQLAFVQDYVNREIDGK